MFLDSQEALCYTYTYINTMNVIFKTKLLYLALPQKKVKNGHTLAVKGQQMSFWSYAMRVNKHNVRLQVYLFMSH